MPTAGSLMQKCISPIKPSILFVRQDTPVGVNKSQRHALKGVPDTARNNRKIGTRKPKTDVGKYSFVNMSIRSWNQLSLSLLASFPCKLNTIRQRIKDVVTSKGIEVGG
jgi:hypothetical protein